MSKTIKELADELGVSKQKIRCHLKPIPVKFTGKDNKKRITINPKGEALIKQKVVNTGNKITSNVPPKKWIYRYIAV